MWVDQHKFFVKNAVSTIQMGISLQNRFQKHAAGESKLHNWNKRKVQKIKVQIYNPSSQSYSLLALWNTWKTFVISLWLVIFFNKNSALVLNRFSTLNKPDG